MSHRSRASRSPRGSRCTSWWRYSTSALLRSNAGSPPGQFNIQFLRLNRPALQKLRAARRKLSKSSAFIAHGVSELLSVGIDVVDKRHRSSFLRFQRALERDYQRTVTSV